MINQSLYVEGNLDEVLKCIERQKEGIHKGLFIASINIVNISLDYWCFTIISDSTRNEMGESRFVNIK